MVDNNNIKKLVGNICLHQDLVPERFFLRRNLRHILDSHERQFTKSTDAGSYEDMIANEQRISGWDFPTREMLMDLMKGEKPILQLDSLQIRHPKSKARIRTRLRNHRNGDEESSWLPDPDAELRLPCRVGISILDTRGTGTNKKPTDLQTADAIIVQNQSAENFSTFNVELSRPFMVELDKFFVVEEEGTHGEKGYRWKRTVTAKYGLEIRIACQSSADTAKLFSRLESRHGPDHASLSPGEGVLRALWEDLPECPPVDHLHTLKHSKGHRIVELDYKLAVSMGWKRKADSPLQKYNQKLLQAQKASRQLPTPSASDDMEHQPPKRYLMSFNFDDGFRVKTMTVESISCPFCRREPHQREYHSLSRLQLHLLTNHSHFEFELDEPVNETLSTVRCTFWIKVAPAEQREKVDDSRLPHEEVKHNWLAPGGHFNESRAVRNPKKDPWLRSSKPRLGMRKGRSARDRERDYVSLTTPQPIRKRPAPDEVEDLPQNKVRKQQVPSVPKVSFYHTASKQVLTPGEYVADSDECVDEHWLTQNQIFGLEELGVTGAAQEFTNAFNQHLACEQSDSSILTKEALVRFARIYHEQLQDIGWQRPFRAKLNQLRRARVIDDDIVSYCVRRLKAQSEVRASDVEADSVAEKATRNKTGPVNGDMLQRPRKKATADGTFAHESNRPSKGKARAMDGDSAAEQEATDTADTNGEGSSRRANPDDSPTTNVCICGSSASHKRDSIACSDQRCKRKNYHLFCVGLAGRMPGWRCKDCKR